MKSYFIQNRKGFSLELVLIAIAVTGAISMGMVQGIRSLQEQNKSFDERVAIYMLRTQLTSVLQEDALCTQLLASSNQQTFDPSNAANTFSLQQIPYSTTSTENLIQVGQIAEGFEVNSIQIKNILASDIPHLYTAQLQIDLTGSSSVSKPVIIPLNFITSDLAGGVKQIDSCSLSSMSATERVVFRFGTGTNTADTFYCNPTCSWQVPNLAKGPAYVTIAGGGSSSIGVLVVNAARSGNSGGFLVSHPVTIVPGQTISVTVGAGGKFFDDPQKILGSPGKPSRFGNLLECSGGGVGEVNSILSPGVIVDSDFNVANCDDKYMTSLYLPPYSNPRLVLGYKIGLTYGLTGVVHIPGKSGGGTWGTNGPGRCGDGAFGAGNPGTLVYEQPTFIYGGKTPITWGSGGDDYLGYQALAPDGTRQLLVGGSYPNGTTLGRMKHAKDGLPGIIIVDYLR